MTRPTSESIDPPVPVAMILVEQKKTDDVERDVIPRMEGFVVIRDGDKFWFCEQELFRRLVDEGKIDPARAVT
jgi:hypothetical protein